MTFLNSFATHSHWALRLALGSVFLYHGLTKFPVLNDMAAMMGMPVAMIALLATIETAGGALVVLGGFMHDWMTRLGALLLAGPMLGAIMMVHWGQWAFAPSATHPMGGMEFQVTLLLLSLYLVLNGNRVNQVAASPDHPAQTISA